MSKIILTEEQGNRLNLAGLRNNGTLPSWYAHVLNEAIAMGLVRPAHDDLAARVAALEAYINGDEPGVPPNVRTPDPHAAAKERAKLWGARLIRCRDKWFIFVTDRAFTASGWSERKDSLGKPDAVLAEEFTGQWSTEYDAWSNFPTEPPPGWEAKAEPVCDCGKIEHGRHHSACPAVSKAKPRTEPDRLGDVARSEWLATGSGAITHWNRIALAVRKAVLARQLEPSEEEVKAALLCWRETLSTVAEMKDILAAAARVRLEKAEGEQS